ncbi:hypothetical protein, conserved [Trypanosoma brucei brucei TREU927]|uniref:Uncharacterized protein n=1 Tax=Trypanosoma brucei brucei (strain 927/4 GUTat10.1) TaxID=185431 RepID=Q57X12_TRYB2|nr:hypothetical protein, conserved [Trypanosoma brucei brucei TREU927]AAX69855.1 hypothetical protein, conserved [Trypanosoma brucei]AAZ13334.1 hypothetical protein, conserved [Trypanosoma brucei brucei TREU927]
MMYRWSPPSLSKKVKGDTFLSSLAQRVDSVAATSSSRQEPGGTLSNLRLGLRGSSTMCRSAFSLHSNQSLVGNRIFECPNKHIFLDTNASYCHLCREPLGVSSFTHLSDREHHNVQLFLFLSAAFPRGTLRDATDLSTTFAKTTWRAIGRGDNTAGESILYHPDEVMDDAARFCPRLLAAVKGGYAHTEQEALRRASLQSMLILLSSGSITSDGATRREPAVLGVFHGDVLPELAHSGERLFKGEVSRLIVEWFPALSAGVGTQIAHKCWGRSNLESVFDALQLQTLINQRCNRAAVRGSGSGWKSTLMKGLTTKTEKATFMRLLMWELTTRNEDVGGDTNDGVSLNKVDRLLLELTRKRLAFEMVYLQSLKYMHLADALLQEMSYPSLEDLVLIGAA